MEANNNDQMSPYANLPADVLEQIVEGLSVVDRLHCEGVNRHWKAVMTNRVWPKVKKFHREMVFEGVTNARQRRQIVGFMERFNDESLVALFRRFKGSVVEADFRSFFDVNNIDAHFRGMMEGCTNLRAVTIGGTPGTEQALRALAVLPRLNELVMWGDKAGFTDAVLKAIARRGQLKKFVIHAVYDHRYADCPLTDDAVEFLIQRCQQLVTLCITQCPNITGRSLRAVVTEVHRRHGNPPRALPTGPLDPGIFYFNCGQRYEALSLSEQEHEDQCGGFDGERRLAMFGPMIGIDDDTRFAIGENPWIVLYENWGLYNRKLY